MPAIAQQSILEPRIVACLDRPPDGHGALSGDDLVVQGWAFDVSAQTVEVELRVGGRAIARSTCDAPRPDVQQAYGDVAHAGDSGFLTTLRVRRSWAPEIVVTVVARSGAAPLTVIAQRRIVVTRRTLARQAAHAVRRRFPRLTAWLLQHLRVRSVTAAAVPDTSADAAQYQRWIALHESGAPARHRCRDDDPLISIIVPVHETPQRFLNELLASIAGQTCPRWELCAVDDGSPGRGAWQTLQAFAASRSNVKLKRRESAGGIAVASNEAIGLAAGEFIVFCDHDDVLRLDAVAVLTDAIRARPAADVLYSDYDILEPDGRRTDPRLKPDWSPDLLRSYMYWGHLKCYRTSLVRDLGALRPEFRGGEDYDLALRLAERTARIVHVPQVLYHWRRHAQSTASSGLQKPYSIESGLKALNQHLARSGIDAEATWPEASRAAGVGLFRLDFRFNAHPSVCIVIPTRDRLALLARCIGTLDAKTDYPNREIIIVDNDSVEPETLEYFRTTPHRVLRAPGAFNFSAMMNQAARATDAEFLLLLNNDTEIVTSDWLARMVGFGRMRGVGAVGAKLLYPDGRIQHLGVVLGHEGLTGHYFQGEPSTPGDFGYLSYRQAVRNVAAVTAACMLTPRRLFLEVGGFDAADLAVAWNDVDYCLRLLQRGYRMVVDPEVVLVHHEGLSRGEAKNEHEVATMFARWRTLIGRDPYYHPGFARTGRSFALRTQSMAAEFPALYYAKYPGAVPFEADAVAADAD